MKNILNSAHFKFDKTFYIYGRLFKGEDLSNTHLEPTTSRITNVVSPPAYPKPRPSSHLAPLFPPTPPPRNPNMTPIKQYSLPSQEGRPGKLGIMEAANQQSFTTMTRIPSQTKCLQSYHNKMKLALMITVLTVVIVTVPVVYTSVIKQNTEIPNINTSDLTQRTDVPTANSHFAFDGMYIIIIT